MKEVSQNLTDKYGLNRKTITKYLKEKNIEITNTRGKVPFNEEFLIVLILKKLILQDFYMQMAISLLKILEQD